MKNQKVIKRTKFLTILLLFITLILTSVGVSFAWFTDKATIEDQTLYFGKIELDADETNPVTTMSVNTSRTAGNIIDGKLMPGDIVNIKITVKLKDYSQPAYYLIYLEDNGLFACDKDFFFKENGNIYATNKITTNKVDTSGTLSESETITSVVGKISAGETHTLNFTLQIDLKKTEAQLKGTKQIDCTISAIQQANLTEPEAYTELTKELAPVTFLNTWKSKISNYSNYTTIGFYKTNMQPEALTLNESLTSSYDSAISETSADKGKIQVYTDADNTNLAFVSNVKILAPEYCESLFITLSNLTALNLDNFNTSNVTSMYSMFYGCKSLISLNLSKFDTSNVTDMESMFCYCESLESLDVSNFDTSNVTDMSYMFYSCSSLTSLDVSNFDTSNVTNMNNMFSCSYASPMELITLDVSNFDTSNVTDMGYMFRYCSNLTTLDVSKFDTSNVTSMSWMFMGCSGLTTLNVSNFDTSKVTNMSNMFSSCKALTTLDVSNFDTSKVTNMSNMFCYCSSLKTLDVTNFDTSNVTDIYGMFSSCKALTTLDVSNFNTSNVTDMSYMFYSCSSLTSLDVSNFDTSKVTDMESMFYKCSSLISLDLSNFNTSNVTDMGSMFCYCESLESLDVSNFDTSNVTDMSYMFYSCSELTTLDVSNFDTSNVTSMSWMFMGCSGLTTLNVSKFNTSNVTDMSYMFIDAFASGAELIISDTFTWNNNGVQTQFDKSTLASKTALSITKKNITVKRKITETGAIETIE